MWAEDKTFPALFVFLQNFFGEGGSLPAYAVRQEILLPQPKIRLKNKDKILKFFCLFLFQIRSKIF
jgi:hypothetical protein